MHFYSAEKKKQEEEHAAQLKKQQDEVAKLKVELAGLTEKHAAEIQALTTDRDHFKEKAKGFQEFGQDKERDLLAARDELHAMKGKAKVWLYEFNKIQSMMSRKPFFLHFLCFQNTFHFFLCFRTIFYFFTTI